MHQNKSLKAGPYANPVIYRKLSQLERGLEAQKNQMAFQGHLVVILHVHQPGIGMGWRWDGLCVNGGQDLTTGGSRVTWEGYRAPGPKGTEVHKDRGEDQSVNKHCPEPPISTCEPRVSSSLLHWGHHSLSPGRKPLLLFLPV